MKPRIKSLAETFRIADIRLQRLMLTRLPFYVRAVCALADWLSRGTWDVRRSGLDRQVAYLPASPARVVSSIVRVALPKWDGWRPIRLL